MGGGRERVEESPEVQQETRRGGWRQSRADFEKQAANRVKYCEAAQGTKVPMALTTEIAGNLWGGQKPAQC